MAISNSNPGIDLKGSPEIRQFVGFVEAAAMLGSDYTGLRQAFNLGLGAELPAYVVAMYQPFLARPIGAGLGNMDQEEFHSIGDGLGELTPSGLPQSVTGLPFTLKLRGYFRVSPHELEAAARDQHVGMARVTPESWWAIKSPVPKAESGAPAISLLLISTNQPGYAELPALEDLQFKIADIEALKVSRAAAQRQAKDAKPLDPRERASLLRIIRALDGMVGLPSQGAATSVEAELQRLGFTKPGEKAILRLINEARALEPDKAL